MWSSRNGVRRSARPSFGRQFAAHVYVFFYFSKRAPRRFRSSRFSPPVLKSRFHPNNKKMNSHNSLETHHANVQLVSRFGKDVFDIF